MSGELFRAFIKYIFERWGMLPFLYVFLSFLVMSLVAMGLGTLGWCRAFDYPPFTLFSPTTCSAAFVNERRISEEKDRVISSLKSENEAVGAENEELKLRLRSGAGDDVAALRSELVRQRKMNDDLAVRLKAAEAGQLEEKSRADAQSAQTEIMKAERFNPACFAEVEGWKKSFEQLQTQYGSLAVQCEKNAIERRDKVLDREVAREELAKTEGDKNLKCLLVPSGSPGTKVRLRFIYQDSQTTGSATIQVSSNGPRVCISMRGRTGLKSVELVLKGNDPLTYEISEAAPEG